MTVATQTISSTSPVSLARVVLAAVAALAGNLVVFAVGSLAGATWQISAPEPITVGTIAFASLVPILAAGTVTWFIAGRRPGFRRFAAWAGLLLALASIASTFFVSSDLTTSLSLAAMHVITGGAWFVGVSPRTSTR